MIFVLTLTLGTLLSWHIYLTIHNMTTIEVLLYFGDFIYALFFVVDDPSDEINIDSTTRENEQHG